MRHDSSHCDYRFLWIAEQSGSVNKRGSLMWVKLPLELESTVCSDGEQVGTALEHVGDTED